MPDPGPIVLLTRPQAASERFASELSGRLGRAPDVIIAPVIRIDPLGEAGGAGWAGLIFTSAHAVAQARPVPGQIAWCVGDATAEAATAAGFDAISANGDAAALIDRIAAAGVQGTLLHLRGGHGQGVTKALASKGVAASEAVVYRQDEVAFDASAKAAIDNAPNLVAPVFSPRSARLLRARLPPRPGLRVVAISDAAARPWGKNATVVPLPSRRDMVQAVVELIDSDSH